MRLLSNLTSGAPFRQTDFLLLGCRHNAELLQHTELVHLDPGFLQFVASEAVDTNECHRHLLTGRGYAHIFTLVCAATCHAGHDLVLLADHVLNSDAEVGESRAHSSEDLLGAFGARRCSWSEAVADVVRRENLFYYGQVTLVKGLLVETAHESLVLFDGQSIPPQHNMFQF